jgi:hypothetical protein
VSLPAEASAKAGIVGIVTENPFRGQKIKNRHSSYIIDVDLQKKQG